MTLSIKPGTTWNDVYARARSAAPEALDPDRIRNLVGGEWKSIGVPGEHVSPVDGAPIPGPPRISHDEAVVAVAQAADEHKAWATTDLDERKRRVSDAVDEMRVERDTLALLLVWEIGKPWRTACADVDRALDGADWYLGEIERQLQGRSPLHGPVSNIASWNYPMSVQVHGELVQLLAGNAVVAKTPSQGGFHTLTLAHAIMRRAGLPVTLMSGAGAELSDALITAPETGALAFVGGRANGRKAATTLVDTGKRHLLEQEGLNAWGVWDFTDWDLLAGHLRKGFEYAKQRCTAYPRYVVQRELFPAFLDAYLPVVKGVTFGHPLAVESPSSEHRAERGAERDEGWDALPELDFGPLIHATKASAVREAYDEAVSGGAIPLYHGDSAAGRFIDGQDTSAYVAPACVLNPAPSWSLHHSEPFGPLDSIVVVDTRAELLAAMNASNGALVASVATDDADFGAQVVEELQAFKVGINKPRSRGDREEPFGGKGASWKGAFVGGDLLVQAVTEGDGQIYGNFPTYSPVPADLIYRKGPLIMKIGVLGTGVVGRAIARGSAKTGHPVKIGTRDPDGTLARTESDAYGSPPLRGWLEQHPDVRLVTFADAASDADMVVNATNGAASLNALAAAGADNLAGKPLLDIANPLDFSRGMPPTLFVKDTDSLAEQIQRTFPTAKVVKSLNTMNADIMVDPASVGAGDHSVFVSGDDDDAKATVTSFLRDLGWVDIVDLGDLSSARGAEMVLPLWLRVMGTVGSPAFNFKIVRAGSA